jgi:hypothetical protein
MTGSMESETWTWTPEPGRECRTAQDGPTIEQRERVQRLIRYYFFACALNAVMAAFAENLNVTLGRTDLEMGIRGVAMLVLMLSFITALLIPVANLLILLAAQGYRSQIFLYLALGYVIWAFHLDAVSYEFAR